MLWWATHDYAQTDCYNLASSIRKGRFSIVQCVVVSLTSAQTTMDVQLCFYGKRKYGIMFLRKTEIRNLVFTENGLTESNFRQ